MLIRHIHQKNEIFVIFLFFLVKGFKSEPYLCNGCHNLMQKSMTFSDITIVSAKENGYRIYLAKMM